MNSCKESVSGVEGLDRYHFLLENISEGVAFYQILHPGEDTPRSENKKNHPPRGRKLKLLKCNQIYIEQSGLRKVDLMEADDIYVFHSSLGSNEGFLDVDLQKIIHNKPRVGFFQWKRPDGKPNWIKYSAVPFSTEEKSYVLGLYTDITDKIIAHDKLQQFYASQSRTIHDFTDPVAGIIGWAREIRRAPDALHSGLTHIEKSANRLLGLVKAGLTMNEAFSDRMEIKPEWILLEDIEVMLDSLFALAVARKGLRWTCDFPIEKLSIFADELRLTQILQNLVTNSLKFTAKGEIKVYCLIEDSAPSKGIDFIVSDTGIGIAKENHQKIFEPYEKLSRSTDGETGYGLGLTTTKELVDRMKGSITLMSQPGHGTTFTVSLPKMEYRLAPSETEEEKAIKGSEKIKSMTFES